jgi:hypothetical protein
MARRNDDEHSAPRRRSPAKTPEERESMLISMAYERAEQQVADGTASSQLLTHFVKAGSTRDRIEKQKLEEEVLVLRKKVETMQSAVDMKNLMEEALDVFKGYQGRAVDDDDDDEFEYYD